MPPLPAVAASQTVLDEKLLKITLKLYLVKPLPPRNKMDFLKKHYEKVMLGVVLLGLAVAVAVLPFMIASEKEKLEEMKSSCPPSESQTVDQPGSHPARQA